VQMAEKLGLDRSYLADVEAGRRNISIVNLDIIARGFDWLRDNQFLEGCSPDCVAAVQPNPAAAADALTL